MNKAFTMIELIFVIVILGILSAVAIPKFTATRADALITSRAMAIGQSITELAEYAVSKNATIDDLTAMSHGINALVNTGSAHKNGEEIIIEIDDEDCISIEIVTNAGNDDIKVEFIVSTNTICLALQARVDKETYSIPLRGLTVVN